MIRWQRAAALGAMLLELVGCSGTSPSASGGDGGHVNSASGGQTSAGESSAGGSATAPTGGTSNRGSSASSGGSSSFASTSGGTASTAIGSGGAKASGGRSSSTGVQTSGGTAGTGGAKTTGSSAKGGSPATGGAKATGGAGVTGGAPPTGGSQGTGGATTGGGAARASVLQHHNHASRDGVYVDAAITKATAATLHVDTSFAGATISGPTYAQPLYLASKGTGPDLVIAATEQNRVYAFNASTGAQVYNVLLGPTLPRSQLASLASFCGNIDPLGITGTPVIDEATRTIYLDAMTSLDGTAANARHQIYALNADTGAMLSGWPVDLNSKVPVTAGTSFTSLLQNQRGALALLGGKVFVPFGGHIGDCGSYHGWVVGVSTTDPTQVSAWVTRAIAGGIWAPGGISSDGTSLFVATGNTEANPNEFTPPDSWQDGEAIFRLSGGLARSSQNTDYFAPTNWEAMDTADQDLGGCQPLVVDVPGATPSSLVVALGKDGKAYALNRANLGGISAASSVATVSSGSIITAPAAYTTPSGTFVAFKGNGSGCPSGQSGGVTAFKIGASSPPTMTVAWCGGPSSNGSVAVSMSSADGQDAIVWIVGTDNKLHGLDGNTGASVFNGGTSADTLSSVQKFVPPIVANGRVFVAANNQVYAFAPP